jgi:hypothetical protein
MEEKVVERLDWKGLVERIDWKGVLERNDWKGSSKRYIFLKTECFSQVKLDISVYRYYILPVEINYVCPFNVGDSFLFDNEREYNDILKKYITTQIIYESMISEVVRGNLPETVKLVDWIHLANCGKLFVKVEKKNFLSVRPIFHYYIVTSPYQTDSVEDANKYILEMTYNCYGLFKNEPTIEQVDAILKEFKVTSRIYQLVLVDSLPKLN